MKVEKNMAYPPYERLTIKTDNVYPSQLATPPESANSRRGSYHDYSYQQTNGSMPHLNAPLQFNNGEYQLKSDYTLNISIKGLNLDQEYPMPTPDTQDFPTGSYYAESSHSPSLQSSFSGCVYDQRSSEAPCFSNDSPMSRQGGNGSRLNHFSSVNSTTETVQSHLYTLPSEDPCFSFLSEADSTGLGSPQAYIAPGQAFYDPAQDYTSHMSLDSNWNHVQSPVSDAMVLTSSSPCDTMPPTPSAYDMSGCGVYGIPVALSPCSSLSAHQAPSCSSGRTQTSKARHSRKVQKRQKDSPALRRMFTDGLTAKQALAITPRAEGHTCNLCERTFRRSEHFKRHMGTHNGEHNHACYIADRPTDPCIVGEGKGKQNRKDNNRSHHWTHVKAWLLENEPLVKQGIQTSAPRKKGRNKHISPAQMLAFVRSRDDETTQDIVLDFLNKEAGKDFDIHILWDKKDCPRVPCVGNFGQVGGCTMCRPPKKTKVSKF